MPSSIINIRIAIAPVFIAISIFLIVACQSGQQIQPEPAGTAAQTRTAGEAPTAVSQVSVIASDISQSGHDMLDWMIFRFELVQFEYNRYDLTPAAQDVLLRKVAWIKENAPEKQIILTGHSDQSGGDAYNKYLSALRANAVKQFLLEHGLSYDKVHIVSAGEKFPLIKGEGPTTWAINRRVEFEEQRGQVCP